MPIGPITLQTDRLSLRPFELDDLDDFHRYHNDEIFSELIDVPYPYSRHDAERSLRGVLNLSWDQAPFIALVLEGVVIGHVDLEIGNGALGEKRPGVADLSYYLARPYWGQGFVPEACRAVIDYAFPAYDLVKLTAFTRAENRPSWRVMEKLGMKREGLLRQHEVAGNGQRVDQIIYGLLREEWEAQLNK
ncbi:MAG: GNAT family N-acetyltransferase [Candidatus Latescibacteria bacterium]|nr:GNAT family N-acetyltransferase [Candidatus Latescibacterota bacterium]